jgi:hypothetical protein
MAAEQPWSLEIQQAAFVLTDQAAALDADMPLLACTMKRRTLALRAALDFGKRIPFLMRANHGNGALDDAGFLGRD